MVTVGEIKRAAAMKGWDVEENRYAIGVKYRKDTWAWYVKGFGDDCNNAILSHTFNAACGYTDKSLERYLRVDNIIKNVLKDE